MLLQQGDVLLKSVKKIPAGTKKVKRQERGWVLAEGEVTGHAHVIDEDIDLILDEAGTMFMSNDAPVTIKHEEHKHITVPAGNWEIGIVKEYDHFAEESRRVQD